MNSKFVLLSLGVIGLLCCEGLGEKLTTFKNEEIILMIDTSGSINSDEYALEVGIAEKLFSFLNDDIYIDLFLSESSYSDSSILATDENKEILFELIQKRKGGDEDVKISQAFLRPIREDYDRIIIVIAGDDSDYQEEEDSILELIDQYSDFKIIYFDILAQQYYSKKYAENSGGIQHLISSDEDIQKLTATSFGASHTYSCDTGEYYDSQNVCQSCEIYHYCPDGESMQVCEDGLYSNSTGLKECNECLAGYYCTNGEIEVCSDYYYSFIGSTKCTLCPSNYACEDKFSEPTECDEDSYSFLGDTECHNNRIIIAEDNASFDNTTAKTEYIDSISNPSIEGEETSDNVFETLLTLPVADSGVTNIYCIPEVKDLDGNTITINYGYFYNTRGSKNIKITLIQNSNNLENFLISYIDGERILSFLIKYSFYNSIDNSLLHVHLVKIKITVTETSSDTATFEVNSYEESVGGYTINSKVSSVIRFCSNVGECDITTATKESPDEIYLFDNLLLIHYLELEQYRKNYIMSLLEVTMSYSSYTLDFTDFVNTSCISGSDCLGSLLITLPIIVRDDELTVEIVSEIAHKDSTSRRSLKEKSSYKIRRLLSSTEGVAEQIGPFHILESANITVDTGEDSFEDDESSFTLIWIFISALIVVVMGVSTFLVWRCWANKRKNNPQQNVQQQFPQPKTSHDALIQSAERVSNHQIQVEFPQNNNEVSKQYLDEISGKNENDDCEIRAVPSVSKIESTELSAMTSQKSGPNHVGYGDTFYPINNHNV